MSSRKRDIRISAPADATTDTHIPKGSTWEQTWALMQPEVPSWATGGFHDTPEAARFLNLGAQTLRNYRCRGGGPKFYAFGNRVLYTLADLTAWAEERRYSSTAEARYAKEQREGGGGQHE